MADIQPFRAYRYDTNRVALKDVLTQPYDKISPEMQERYYSASPYNLIAIEKGRILPGDANGNNVYTRAAKKVDEWIAEKVLAQDAAPEYLHLFAGISGAGDADAAHPDRIHRAGPRGGLRRDKSSSGTSERFRRRRPTASNCCGTRAYKRGSFFYFTTIPPA